MSLYDDVNVEGIITGMSTDLASGIVKALAIGAGLALGWFVWNNFLDMLAERRSASRDLFGEHQNWADRWAARRLRYDDDDR